MLAGFQVVENPTTVADGDQHDAMLGVLDALIQFGAGVPLADAQRLYPEFPVQSLILLSRSRRTPRPRSWPSLRVSNAIPPPGWPPETSWCSAGPKALPRPSSPA